MLSPEKTFSMALRTTCSVKFPNYLQQVMASEVYICVEPLLHTWVPLITHTPLSAHLNPIPTEFEVS